MLTDMLTSDRLNFKACDSYFFSFISLHSEICTILLQTKLDLFWKITVALEMVLNIFPIAYI